VRSRTRCEDGSAGIKRGWAGLPRKFHTAGERLVCVRVWVTSLAQGTKEGQERCVCAPQEKLSDKRLRVYEGCDEYSPTCVLPPVQKS
jgi:hypothetical protein